MLTATEFADELERALTLARTDFAAWRWIAGPAALAAVGLSLGLRACAPRGSSAPTAPVAPTTVPLLAEPPAPAVLPIPSDAGARVPTLTPAKIIVTPRPQPAAKAAKDPGPHQTPARTEAHTNPEFGGRN